MKKYMGIMLFVLLLVIVMQSPVIVRADTQTIPYGDYIIVNNGVYQLSSGYSGTITVSNAVYEITVTDSVYMSYHTETAIRIEGGRVGALEITIENLSINAGLAGVYTLPHLPGIDFGEAGNYAHKLYISGACIYRRGLQRTGGNQCACRDRAYNRQSGRTD